MLDIKETRTITPVPKKPKNQETAMSNQVDTNHTMQLTPEQLQQMITTAVEAKEKQPKSWFKSKTVLINGAVTAVGVAMTLMPYLQPFVGAEQVGVAMTVLGAANTVLRYFTSAPMKGGKGS